MALAALFFVSGLSSLVLQTVWTRLMVLVFGSTTFAVSTVLTAFMGGLALGSFIAGRMARRLPSRRSGVLVYGALELVIGLYALALPVIVAALPAVHRAIWGDGAGSYTVFALLRFSIAAVVLLVPTVAMGATLPVLAHVFCEGRDPAETGRQVGTLYAVNTAGAVVGVVLAGFVLLPNIGLFRTNLGACIADGLLAVLALWLYRRDATIAAPAGAAAKTPAATEATETPETRAAGEGAARSAIADHGEPSAGERRLARAALLSVAVSGAMAMAYEVAWTRALTLVIGSSTYAFSLILACVLVGLAGGAALYARRQTSESDQATNLALAHLLAAVTAAAGVALIDDLPAVMLVALKKLTLTPGAAFVLKFALSAAVVLLPSFFFGMVFPAVVRSYAALRRGPSETTGAVYAVNTLGAIVGAFTAGFVLVPALGLQTTLLLLVGLGLALAGGFALLSRRRRRGVAVAAVCMLSLVAVMTLVRPWNLQALSAGVFRVSRYAGLVKSLRVGDRRTRRGDRSGAAKGTSGGAPARTPAARRGWRALALALVPPRDVVDTFAEPTAGSALIRHVEGVTTTVGVSRSVDASLSGAACWVRHALLVNGKPDASLSVLHARPARGCGVLLGAGVPLGPPIAPSPSGDMETQLLSGLLPRVLRGGRDDGEALVIGWGSGITAAALLAGSQLRVTAVELERAVIDAATRHFAPFGARRRHPRLRIVAEDGRNYLAASPKRYAIIVSEPSNPWMAGCGNLFTREFFRVVRAHLAPDGVLLQWLQAYEIAPRNVASILATLRSVFDDVLVFGPVQASADMLLVARNRRGSRGADAPLSWPALVAGMRVVGRARVGGTIGAGSGSSWPALRLLGIRGPEDLIVRLHAGPAGVDRVARGAPLNTDDNARIEFAAPRDLIEYRRYSPRAIVRSLRKAARRGAALVARAPADAGARLCWARLRAGQAKQAAATVGGARACRAAARMLRSKLAPPSPADVRALFGADAGRATRALAAVAHPRARHESLTALERLFAARSPRWRYAALALMGHVEALAGNTFEALLYLGAARVLAARGASVSGGVVPQARYRPLRALITRMLWRAGQHHRVVTRLRRSL